MSHSNYNTGELKKDASFDINMGTVGLRNAIPFHLKGNLSVEWVMGSGSILRFW